VQWARTASAEATVKGVDAADSEPGMGPETCPWTKGG
jgi:hypothetical protein